MKTRNITQLLELVLTHFITKDVIPDDVPQTGICQTITFVMGCKVISAEEESMVRSYIERNRPTRTNRYSHYYFPVIDHPESFGYFWPQCMMGEEYKHVRIEFLRELIADS